VIKEIEKTERKTEKKRRSKNISESKIHRFKEYIARLATQNTCLSIMKHVRMTADWVVDVLTNARNKSRQKKGKVEEYMSLGLTFDKKLKGRRIRKCHHDCSVFRIAPSMESASQPVCKRHEMRTNSNGTVEKCIKVSHVEDIYSYAAKSSVGRN
jgi:hypothetical protein